MPTVPPYVLTARAATQAPFLPVEGARPLGPLVPASAASAAPPTLCRYDDAVTLVDAMRTTIREVTDKKGPRATINALDMWLYRSEGWRLGTGILSASLALVGGVVTLIAGCAVDGNSTVATVAGAVTAVSGVIAVHTLNCEHRVDRKRTRHNAEKLDSSDVERALAPYADASPRSRALLQRFVRSEIAGLDDSLSPKAALTRDRLLSLEACTSEQDPALGRISELVCAMRALRDGGDYGHERKHITAIEHVIDQASADERREIATTLQKVLFKGEHPAFKGQVSEQRRLYAAIQLAERGEPIKKEGA